jgi:hypothetical protein
MTELSDTELSDSEPFSYQAVDRERLPVWAQVSTSPCKSPDDRQPLLVWPVAKLTTKKSAPSALFLSKLTVTAPPPCSHLSPCMQYDDSV